MKISREDGVALVLAILMTLALSALTAALITVSRTETWSGMNYRMLAQSRYGAEAGVHRTASHLLNSYTPPGGAADPLANYNTTVTPVTYNGQPVILSSIGLMPANYPVASVSTAFQTGTHGSVGADTFTVAYASYATLLSMRQVTVYGSTAPATIQRWQITGIGTIAGTRNATQEVSAILEQQVTPAFSYGVFSTGAGCGALSFSGGGSVDSYDSSNIQMQNGQVVTQQSGGSIGTNGNMGESGNATIYGNMSTPRSGVGACTANNVTAETITGHATVTGSLVELPQAVSYPAPALPNPLPPTTNVTIHNNTSLVPGPYGNINVNASGTLHLSAGEYDINSISLAGGGTLVVDSGPVVLNVAGQSQTTPIDFTGGALVNSSVDPGNLQILYAGNGQVTLTGNAQASALLYAPNASVNVLGNSNWFGAIVANTLDDTGGAAIHVDRHLLNSFFIVGNPMLHSFTWKKF